METTVVTSEFFVKFNYRGEQTQVLVINRKDGFTEGFGQVTRHPNDRPNRLVGEKYALTKALAASNLNREQRTEIWAKYRPGN